MDSSNRKAEAGMYSYTLSAVEKAGLSTLNDGQQVEFEIVSNRGKSSAENLKVK
jgi:cold shock CspA family protein